MKEPKVKFEDENDKEKLHFGIDISKGPGLSYGGNKFWILIVDKLQT